MSSPAKPAASLDMPEDRRSAAEAHAAMLSETVRRFVIAGLPLQADVDDFRRVLMAAAPGEASK